LAQSTPAAFAAANLLTNPQLDPMGKIPEFKFCAAKVEPVRDEVLVAAEWGCRAD
jgi:formate dehydrogenase major subunit